MSEDGTMTGSIDGNKSRDKINQPVPTEESIKILCTSMKKQIISRAFYGWLAHCRHLRTVRTHLAGLINPTIVPVDKPRDSSGGLTKELWQSLIGEDTRVTDPDEVRRLIYYGGCDHEIRRTVWLYLLGHHDFAFTEEERKSRDQELSHHYELTMTEWLAVEAIVRQRDKEIMAANLAKLSSESNNSTESQLMGPRESMSCRDEVFSSFSDSEVDEKEINGNDASVECNSNGRVKQNIERDNGQLARDNSPDLKEREEDESSCAESRKGSSNPRDGPKRQRKISGDTNFNQNIVITNPSLDLSRSYSKGESKCEDSCGGIDKLNDEQNEKTDGGLGLNSNTACISPASSNGGVYPVNIDESFSPRRGFSIIHIFGVSSRMSFWISSR